jgi:hypothetical protein
LKRRSTGTQAGSNDTPRGRLVRRAGARVSLFFPGGEAALERCTDSACSLLAAPELAGSHPRCGRKSGHLPSVREAQRRESPDGVCRGCELPSFAGGLVRHRTPPHSSAHSLRTLRTVHSTWYSSTERTRAGGKEILPPAHRNDADAPVSARDL